MSKIPAKSSVDVPREPRDNQEYGVKVLVEGSTPIADLVLVHGLNGHREQTWAAENNVLWPREYLPSIIPNMRVLSWGYDGRTNGAASSFSCQRLYDLGVSLATELTLHRKHTKALIHSSSVNERNLGHHSSIKTSTFGILFFGTPHQGSDILASSKTPLISLKSINDVISKNISGHSEYLQKQLGQFNHISSDFVTKCFYETYKEPSQRTVAVAISSATIPGAMDVEVFAINSTHEEMVRYKSADDERFKKVSYCIKSMVDDAQEKVLKNWQEWNRVKAARINGVELTFEIPFEPEYRRNPHFTGREDLLNTLHKKIEKSSAGLVTVVLYGTGGIGKTQIASEYTHIHRAEYQSIFWINTATKESTKSGIRTAVKRLVAQHAKIAYDTSPNYALIAKHLDIIGALDEHGVVSSHEDHTQCILRGFQRWLSSKENKQWLLIFDNVDDIDSSEIQEFIPKTPHGTVIMTSRRTECCHFGSGLRVEEMQEKEGEDLLLKSASLEEDPLASEVTKKLGLLPLAIVQAGAYVAVRQMSLAKYLKIYEERFNSITAEKPATWDYGDRTVRTTWEISFEAIKESNERAAELLSLFSFFSNENIRDDMIRRGKELKENDITLDDSLALLFSYSLAHRKGFYDTFYIHPVVHMWARKRLSDPERVRIMKEGLATIITAVGYRENRMIEDISYEGKVLEHIIIMARHVGKCLKQDLVEGVDVVRITAIADILSDRGYFEYSKAIQSMVFERFRQIFGNENPITLTAMSRLASIYTKGGQYKEAKVLQVQLLEARQRILGKDHPDTLVAINNLSITYTHEGQYREAMVLQQQILEGSQHIFGNEHLFTLKSMNNLAMTYMNQGRYKEAEVLQIQLLEGRQHTQGNEHPDVLSVINNLALIYQHQGQYEKAKVLQLQILEPMQRILGNAHPETLTLMNNLVVTYIYQNQYKEAEVLQLQLLETNQRIFGNEHPNTLAFMHGLAIAYGHHGDHKEAEALQLQLLEARQRTQGKEHPDTLIVMRNLAATYTDQGQYKEAEVLELQVLEASQRILGNEHPNTLAVMSNLAATYRDQGQYKEAEVLELQVLEASQRILGNENPVTLAAMSNLAATYKAQGQFKEVEVLLLQVLEASQRILGNEHSDTLAVMKNLAATYMAQGQFKEVEVLLLQVLETSQRILGNEHSDTLAAMNNLAAVYMIQGQYKEAEALQLQAVEVMKCTLGNQHPITLEAIKDLKITRCAEGASLLKIIPHKPLLEKAEEAMIQVAPQLGLQSYNSEEGIVGALSNDDLLITLNQLATTLGENHPVTIESMLNLISSLLQEKRWNEAEKFQLKLLEFTQKTFGKDNQYTIAFTVHLAQTHFEQKKYMEAEELLLPITDVTKCTLGRDHEETLSAMRVLAVVYMHQGRMREAMELTHRVENIDDEMSLQGAITMSLQQDTPEEEASSHMETKPEKHRLDCLKEMANKAATHWNLGEWKEAENLELTVVRSRQMILGKEDSRTLMAMINLSGTYREQERWKDAEALEKQVMESRKRVLGNKHADTLTAMKNLVGTYTDQKRWNEAQVLHREVVSVMTETLGEENDMTLSAITALATNYWYQGELGKAKELELRLLEVRRKVSGNDNPRTITAIGNLAATCAGQTRFDEAEKLQEEVLETLTRTQGHNHSEIKSAKELLELYHHGRMIQRGEVVEQQAVNEQVLEQQVVTEQLVQEQAVQQQVTVTPLNDIAHKAAGFFLVFSLFFLSFWISFFFAFFKYLVRLFLPTFSLCIRSQEAMVQKWKKLVEGDEGVDG